MLLQRYNYSLLTVGLGAFLFTKGPKKMWHWVEGIYWKRRMHEIEYQPPKLVIVGSGWAAVLRGIIPGLYNVSIVSPENYFLFTPLLASSAVGTVEARSIVEPIRRITSSFGANYVCAEVTNVYPDENFITCKTLQGQELAIEFDYLVLAVGAEVNNFNIPGVRENALNLKRISDARAIRQRIISNYETALIPNIDPEIRQRLMTNIIVGGGPSGVEFAAELYDLIHDDLPKIYPLNIIQESKVIIIQSADHILNTYDLKISQYAERLFSRNGIQVLTNAKVQEVLPEEVVYFDKTNRTVHSLPSGLCVWATGIDMVPLVKKLSKSILGQMHDRALVVNSWLQVRGVKRENIFAVGDCASIELPALWKYIEPAVKNYEKLTYKDIKQVTSQLAQNNPQLKVHLSFLEALFKRYSKSNNGLSLEVAKRLVEEVEATLRSLPATAQVAQQEGKYVGDLLNSIAMNRLKDFYRFQRVERYTMLYYPPFTYRHAGMSAYVGSQHAVLDLGKTYLADRFLAFWLWRSIYLSEQVSYRTRLMVAFDWMKTCCFGRDVSNP